MHRFNGYDIELTRGDSLLFRINLSGRDLPEGSVGLFTVKAHPRDEHALIHKRVDASGELLSISLSPKETNLQPRTYFWDVRILIPQEQGGYELETPMEYAAFTILDAIGRDFGVADDPGMDENLPVLQVLIEQARQAIQEIQWQGGPFAPAILSTHEGGAITDAVGGWAQHVVTSFSHNGEGLSFVPHDSLTLSVNDESHTILLPPGVYEGTFDWITGALSSTAEVVKASSCSLTDSGVNSSGLLYVKLDMPDAASRFIACDSYIRNDEFPYNDKSVRVANRTIYIYDSDIDLNDAPSFLEKVKFLVRADTPVLHQLEGRKIALNKGENRFSPEASVTYAIDTRTYIDQKFAALSAAIVGG